MADTNFPSQPGPPPISPVPSRRTFFWPLVLIGGGVLALLFNLGLVDWYLVGRLTGLWPVLLILLGAQLLLRGAVSRRVASVTGAILLLLLVLWLVAGIASIPGQVDTPPNGDGFRTTAFSGPAGDLTAATLELNGGATAITVAGADLGSDLYRVSMTVPNGEKPLVNLDGATGVLHVETPHRNGFGWPFNDQRRSVKVTLANRLPWQLRGSLGATRGTLDLTGVKLSGLKLDSGASNLAVRLPQPSGTVPVAIDGGALQLTITRPSGTPTQVSMDGGASNLTIDGRHFAAFAHGIAFTSSGYEAASDRIDIQLQSGASNVVVTS